MSVYFGKQNHKTYPPI